LRINFYPIKQEIMQVVFHHDRIKYYLNKYSYNIIEDKFI
jgi:hypothetical protein